MKSILYVGATLMIGASIYGFVDYKNTSQQKEFSSMYDEEKKTSPVTEEKVISEPVDKKLIAEKKAGDKHEIAVTVKDTKESKPAVTKKSKPVVKKAKKKKFDHRIFSRAPLRDEEINMPELVKPEEKKIEKKEQL
jgi:hypothetical protein